MKLNWKNTSLSLFVKLALGGLLVYALASIIWPKKSIQIPIIKVGVQKPIAREITEYVTQTGNVVAYNSVDLVARVEGYLDTISFTDGSFVKQGTPLFIIQPEPYLEKLKEAQATVAAQNASHAYAKSEYARQQRMYKENATSLNSVESWLARTEETQADVYKAIANEEIAKINYSYTHISAPFDGRIGRHQVDIGNLVGNGAATVLANIEQISPIYVYFNLNELDLITLRKAARRKTITPDELKKIPVFVRMQNESEYKHEGHLDFVNTGLNASTGTIEFRAILENSDYALLPGLFVQVRIPTTNPQTMLTVPETAILYDQSGPYVLTLDKDNMVKLTRITLGTADRGYIPVSQGLDPDDKVIIRGLQFATPGHKVEAYDL